MNVDTYIIRGGVPGRERLRLLAEIVRPSTAALLARIGPAPGSHVLDLGGGGGDSTEELARCVGPEGRVVGLDFDPAAVDIAGKEARMRGRTNVRFLAGDLFAEGTLAAAGAPFDAVYARFLLSHVADPDAALALIREAIRPGGRLIIEDVEFAGHFCHPPATAFDRYVALYQAAARQRRADADIGPSLPARIAAAGFAEPGMSIAQPAGWAGPIKLIAALTMENIAPAVAASGLASAAELDELVAELYRIGRDGRTIMSTPRVFQIWARQPS